MDARVHLKSAGINMTGGLLSEQNPPLIFIVQGGPSAHHHFVGFDGYPDGEWERLESTGAEALATGRGSFGVFESAVGDRTPLTGRVPQPLGH